MSDISMLGGYMLC